MAALATKFRMPTKPLASEAGVADVTIESFQFPGVRFPEMVHRPAPTRELCRYQREGHIPMPLRSIK